MKKLLLILMVLGVAAPLYAAGRIQFSVTDNWDGTCTIVYDANSTFDVAPVAMGLTVKVTSGNPIKSVALDDPCDFFEIYMDAAWSMEDPCGDPCVGYTYGAGTPYADPCGPGEVSLTTHGNHFVLSFGGLGGELEKIKSPPMSGTITLKADTGATPTVGTIKLDARRGGVIGADGAAMETNLDDPAKAGPMAFSISECYVEADAVTAVLPNISWYDSGKPLCWCYGRQASGDADGLYEGSKLKGYFFVGIADIGILASAWTVKEPPKASEPYPNGISDVPNGICADFAHDQEGSKLKGFFRVGINDIGILASNWTIKEPTKGLGVPVDLTVPPSTQIDPTTLQPGSNYP